MFLWFKPNHVSYKFLNTPYNSHNGVISELGQNSTHHNSRNKQSLKYISAVVIRYFCTSNFFACFKISINYIFDLFQCGIIWWVAVLAALEFTGFFFSQQIIIYETSANCGKVLAKMLTHQNGSLQLLHSQIVSVVAKLAKTNKFSKRYIFLFYAEMFHW